MMSTHAFAKRSHARSREVKRAQNMQKPTQHLSASSCCKQKYSIQKTKNREWWEGENDRENNMKSQSFIFGDSMCTFECACRQPNATLIGLNGLLPLLLCLWCLFITILSCDKRFSLMRVLRSQSQPAKCDWLPEYEKIFFGFNYITRT